MRYFFFAVLFAITSCSDKQNNANDINSSENRYSDDQVYFFGDIALLKKNNLPLTGYKLEYDQGGGYSETYYINGLKEGGERDYYPGGLLKSESNYKNGERDGEQRDYYKNGSLESQSKYKNGESDGYQFSWYENGRKGSESFYRNGEREGKYIRWYENGQVAEISNYENGLRIGWQRAYSENGELMYEANLINGNGLISYRSIDNNIQVNKNYILGKLVNIENGEAIDLGPFDRDYMMSGGRGKPQIEGYWSNSFKNGEKVMSVFKGPNSISTENYKNELSHGKNHRTYRNGQKEFEGEYFFDQKDGIHQSWYENGKLQEIRKYDKGILISANCWDESGKEVECDCYDNGGKKIKCP